MKITKAQLRKIIREQTDRENVDPVEHARSSLNKTGAMGGKTFLATATDAIADAFGFDDFNPGQEEDLQDAVYEAAAKWYAKNRARRTVR